jgi:hypothetical protein
MSAMVRAGLPATYLEYFLVYSRKKKCRAESMQVHTREGLEGNDQAKVIERQEGCPDTLRQRRRGSHIARRCQL